MFYICVRIREEKHTCLHYCATMYIIKGNTLITTIDRYYSFGKCIFRSSSGGVSYEVARVRLSATANQLALYDEACDENSDSSCWLESFVLLNMIQIMSMQGVISVMTRYSTW